MKGMLRALATVAALGAMVAAISARAEERAPAAPPTAAAAKAKIGDPVACALDGMRMPLAAETPRAEYGGEVYYFCSEAENQTFLREPERYLKH